MSKLLNTRNIQTTLENVAKFVQAEKVSIAQDKIRLFQTVEIFPKEYNSFVDNETEANLYKDPDKFFQWMKKSDKYWDKDFIFVSIRDQSKLIREATEEAYKILDQKTRQYVAAPNISGSQNKSTGFYERSFRIDVDGKALGSINELKNIVVGQQAKIINLAEYASSLEVKSLYYARTGGVMYYAAQMISRKYPELSVQFGWEKADWYSASHVYDVPVLTIGPKGEVREDIRKPGVNLRRDPRRRWRRSNRG